MDPGSGASPGGQRVSRLVRSDGFPNRPDDRGRRGDGVTFPSTYFAFLVRKLASADGEVYVIDISVILPELDQGSTLAEGAALTLESYALEVIGC